LYLERGGVFFEELRPVLVKALRGEARPGHRVKSITTYWREVQIALFVSAKVKEGCGRDKAVQQAADKFRVTKRKAHKAVARHLFKAEHFKNPDDLLRRISDFVDYGAVLFAGLRRGEKK
jgi:hypothetical protein